MFNSFLLNQLAFELKRTHYLTSGSMPHGWRHAVGVPCLGCHTGFSHGDLFKASSTGQRPVSATPCRGSSFGAFGMVPMQPIRKGKTLSRFTSLTAQNKIGPLSNGSPAAGTPESTSPMVKTVSFPVGAAGTITENSVSVGASSPPTDALYKGFSNLGPIEGIEVLADTEPKLNSPLPPVELSELCGLFRQKPNSELYSQGPVLSDSAACRMFRVLKKHFPRLSKDKAHELVRLWGKGDVRRDRFLNLTNNLQAGNALSTLYQSSPILSETAVAEITRATLALCPHLSMTHLREHVAFIGQGLIKENRFRDILQRENLWNPQTSVAHQCANKLRDETKVQHTPVTSVAFNAKLSKGEGCTVCGLKEHRGVDIHVFGECDHIYGQANSNAVRLLCRNCHNQTVTTVNQSCRYRGKESWSLVTVPDLSHDLKTVNVIPESSPLEGGLKAKQEALIRIASNKSAEINLESFSGRGRDIFKLARAGVSVHHCSECGIEHWRGMPMSVFLELHHMNGDHKDNRLENLTMLCGNCHAIKHRRPMSEKPFYNNALTLDEVWYHYEHRTVEVMPRLAYYVLKHARCPATRTQIGQIFGYEPHRIMRLFNNHLATLNHLATAKKPQPKDAWCASTVKELVLEAFSQGVFSGNYPFCLNTQNEALES